MEEAKNMILDKTYKAGRSGHWRRSGAVNVNFVHISHLVLVFLLLTLSR